MAFTNFKTFLNSRNFNLLYVQAIHEKKVKYIEKWKNSENINERTIKISIYNYKLRTYVNHIQVF